MEQINSENLINGGMRVTLGPNATEIIPYQVKQAISSSGTTITFTPGNRTIVDWEFNNRPYLYDSNGAEVLYTLVRNGRSGFTITPAKNCFMIGNIDLTVLR